MSSQTVDLLEELRALRAELAELRELPEEVRRLREELVRMRPPARRRPKAPVVDTARAAEIARERLRAAGMLDP